MLATSGPGEAVDTLQLTSPLPYQVFQRQSATSGRVLVQGQAPSTAHRVEARLLGHGPDRRLSTRWRHVTVGPVTGVFRSELQAPAGGWYACEIRTRTRTRGTRPTVVRVEQVGVGDVFLIAGQSNSGNHGSERQRPASGLVVAFDGRRWRPADDPQPGASGDGGSFVPALGDALVGRFNLPVGFLSVGAGGTSVREWLPRGDRMTNQPTTGAHVVAVAPGTWESTGELFDRLANRLRVLGPGGCRAILWHQGESDAGQARSGYPADRQITGDQYRQFMERLVRASRDAAGWDVPWVTAQATYHSEADPADPEFRAAQAALWESGLTLPGPDTDALRAGYRDGVHFSAQGLTRHGELWAEKVSDWLTRPTSPAARR